jgi:phenylacetate-CoA ligase
MIERLTWGRAQIDALQAEALRRLLRYATAHSSWHAARLRHVDIESSSFRLDDLLTMNKRDLMENWDEIVTVPGATRSGAEQHLKNTVDEQYLWGDHVLMASGGTGGSPGLFLYDWNGLALNFASLSRTIMDVVGRQFGGRPLRIASIGAGVSAHGSYIMARIFSDPANTIANYPVWETPELLFPALNAFDPELMFCTSSYSLQLLAGHRAGTLRIDPKLIFFGSEHLTQAAHAAVCAAWPNTLVVTCWGTTEAAGTFACPLGDGFHVSEDLVILEPRNEHDAPCEPGELSHSILLTNLYNMALPLIRYRIDDVFEFDQAPCACGIAFRKVKQVQGRSTERFRYGALSIHALLVELAILEQPEIKEYQILQTRGGVRIRYSAAAAADETRMRERVVRDMRQYGLASPEVEIERVGELARSATGKLQRFVPLSDDRRQTTDDR